MSKHLARIIAALLFTTVMSALSFEGAAQQPPGQQVQPQRVQHNAPWAISAEQQVRLDQIVNFWSFSSGQIETFECTFERLDYSQVWVPQNPNVAYSIANGVIRYASPDKGMYRVDNLQFLVMPLEGEPQYQARAGQVGENWVCDGKSIFEFKTAQQEVVETRLPPEMQGAAISDGPLPFLFGVEANKLFDRYWIRELPAPQGANEYWLEAVPKRAEDAANFSSATIILDAGDFLPSALQLVMPGGNERKVFKFDNRKKNNVVANLMQRWLNNFIEPETPNGWRTVVQDFSDAGASEVQPGAEGQHPAAQLPMRDALRE